MRYQNYNHESDKEIKKLLNHLQNTKKNRGGPGGVVTAGGVTGDVGQLAANVAAINNGTIKGNRLNSNGVPTGPNGAQNDQQLATVHPNSTGG